MFKDEFKTFFALKNIKRLISFIQLFLVIILYGCSSAVILNPKGYVGESEKWLIIVSAALMLIVVIPAIVMTFLFAWRYRESNKNAEYAPEWKTSFIIETIIWTVPTLIVIALSAIVWIKSHELDPYRPLDHQNDPLTIEVISLDWKWLFIYPEQQIATVNQIVFPVNTPIHFFLTSASVMNSFFIPQLGSQIMTMGGMQTELYLIAHTPGTYDGISANFSGTGFTGMKFNAIASSENDFKNWVNNVKKSSKKLDQNNYLELAKPSLNNPVEYFSSVPPNLFTDIIAKTGS